MHKVVGFKEKWSEGIDLAVDLLRASKRDQKILVEQNRNLGDTLHLIPIIRHYRVLHPDAEIVFIVAKPYANAWAYNDDVNAIVTIPSLEPKPRIALRKKLLEFRKEIKVISPSIFPYGEVWPELKWSYANIADQYLYNAGIKDLEPAGGRRLIIKLDDNDRQWAADFATGHKLNRKNSCGLEYISYSHQPGWGMGEFKDLVVGLKKRNIACVSIAGADEPIIPGTINAKGISWRQTAALMNHLGAFCGIGSGITMVAAAAEDQPKIIELAVSESITMKGCGYAESIRVGTEPNEAIKVVSKLLK